MVTVQLTLNEIYHIKVPSSEFEFTLFSDIDDLFYQMEGFLREFKIQDSNKDIIIFMYDHCDEDSFCGFNYLTFYLGFLQNIPHSSLYIVNESYKSKSMILNIKRYYTITEIINSGTSFYALFFAAKVANDIFTKGGHNECDELISLEIDYYKYFTNETAPPYTFHAIREYLLSKKENKEIISKFKSSFAHKADLFFKIIEIYHKQFSNIPSNYEKFHSIFQKSINAVKKALKEFNCSNNDLLIILIDLTKNGLGFPSMIFEKHKNHFIITNSNDRGSYPSFGTINARDIDNIPCKIIPGSPVMASFIIEALMINPPSNQSESRININVKNIEELVYGKDEKLIMEYAMQCPQNRYLEGESKKKLWIRLNISYWASDNILEKECFLKADISNKLHYIPIIMKKIGFSLASSCKIQFSQNGYCTTKKMQPYLTNQKSNVIGVRLVIRDQGLYKYDEDHFTEVEYYSDGQSIVQTSNGDDIIPNPSLNIIENDYDLQLDQSHVDKIKKKIEKLDEMCFQEGIFKVFQAELNEIIKCQGLQQKSSQKDQNPFPIYIRSDFNEWTGHFLDTYLIETKKDELFLLFNEFTNKYQLSYIDIKNIFCHCMNVADQIITPLIYKKTAFFVTRLKNNHV